jgi:hypothetical protein
VFCKVIALITFQAMLTQRGLFRLGQKVQKDEWLPRSVETLQRANVLPPIAVIAAGSAYSAANAVKSSRISTC